MKSRLIACVTFLTLGSAPVALAQMPILTGPQEILREVSPTNGLTRLEAAYDPVGDVYLVVWARMGNGGPIRAQFLNGNGAAIGNPFDVSQGGGWAGYPKIAFGTHEGRFLVTYTKPGGGGWQRIGRFVSHQGAGAPQMPDSEFHIASWFGHGGSDGDVEYSPATRKFLVGWWSWQTELPRSFVTVIDGASRAVQGTHQVSASPDGESDPQIACDVVGNRCLVVGYSWGLIPGYATGTQSTWGRFFNATTGEPIGNVFYVAHDASHTEQAVTFSPSANKYVVSFTRALQHLHSVTVDALTGALGDRVLVRSPTNSPNESQHGGGFGSSRLARNPANNELVMSMVTWNGWSSMQTLNNQGAPIAGQFVQLPSPESNYEFRSKWTDIVFAADKCELMVIDIQRFWIGRSAKLRACDGAGTAPSTPTSVSPSGSINTNQPTFVWNASSGATSYELHVANAGGSQVTGIGGVVTAAAAGCAGGSGTCQLLSPVALTGGEKSWWVRASNAVGESAWSTERRFTVPTPALGAPVVVAPTGTLATSQPTYRWESVAGATHYRLWVDDSSANQKVDVIYTAAQVACAAGGTCAVTPNIALANGAAYVWVQASNGGLSAPTWSAPRAFIVNVVIAPPVLIGPSTESGTRSPTFSWLPVPTAAWYLLWVDDSNGHAYQQWYTSAEAGCAGNVGICSATPAATLAQGAATFWVLSWKPTEQSWSQAMDFTVTASLARPSSVSVSGSTDRTLEFRWQASGGATWYEIYISDVVDGRYVRWITAEQAGCAAGTGMCSFVPGAALAGSNGWMWVRAWNQGSGASLWSSVLTFTFM